MRGIAKARIPAVVLLGLLVLLGPTGTAPAQATGYRYWSFWQLAGGTWRYAQVGPVVSQPEDGAVEGWRFTVSSAAVTGAGAKQPRGTADFAAICATTHAQEGRKRIALVIDFGTPGDAPGGDQPPPARTACARVPDDASSAEALAAVAKPLRYNSDSLLCAIAGYPKSGCGEAVSVRGGGGDGNASGGGDGGGGPSVSFVAGVAGVVVLGGAALWQARRRHRAGPAA